MFYVSTCEGCQREFVGPDSEGLIIHEYEHYVNSYNDSNGDIRHTCCRYSIIMEEDGCSVRSNPSYRCYNDWKLMRSGTARHVGDDGNLENGQVGKWINVPEDLIRRFADKKQRLIKRYG
ncbi:MAG: hypothetical protein NTY75_02145 [Candidatus Shapirobacteria bacterium]|nr:hypothetical protein [Candidatus Shapirobacteria bacterium]